MKNSREFKQSEVGKIPKEWEVKNIKDIGSLQYGITTTAKKVDTGIRFLRITDITDSGISWNDVPFCGIKKDEFQKYALKEGNVLFARIGATTGKTCYIKKPHQSVFGSYLLRLQPTINDLDTKFLYFFTQSSLYWRQVNASKGGQLKGGLNTKLLGNITLPLPPLPEQKKIAEILSTADAGIQKVDEAIEKTERLKKGLMHELLTKGIGHKEFKDTEIGRIPKEWGVKSIDEIGTLQYGVTKTATKDDTGIRFLRITDITDHGIKWDGVPYCELTKSELGKYELKQNDVLFARIGATTGKTCFIEKTPQSVYGSYLLRFIPTTVGINTNFIYFFTQSLFYWRQVNANKGGQLKGGLNTKLLGNIKLPLPPLPEQQKISKILSTVDKKLELLREKKETFEKIKKGLMGDLLTGKKRVKLEA
jgi:type I restriction enzyme S subunit